ncbi:hypothetical protein IFR05_016403 [Cadophora sp. M221]|nr:hypothetical protein IFR05_016403 [Cadophora sp. M221]
MPKTSSKRKSESALPAGKSKRRKTSTQRGDASDSVGDESSGHLFVGKEPIAPKLVKKQSRRSEPVKRTVHSDEYEEDKDRSEGRLFLASVKFAKNIKKETAKANKEFMIRFEGKLEGAEDSMRMYLQDASIEASKQDSVFTETFKNAYAASRPLPPTANGESQAKGLSKDISFATLFDRSQRMIEDVKLVIEQYETAREKSSRVETARFTDNKWGQENKRTAEILAAGHKIGLEKYTAMLMGASGPEIEDDDSIAADLIYPEVEEGSTSIPWGGVARKGEKTMRKLVKAIVMEVV